MIRKAFFSAIFLPMFIILPLSAYSDGLSADSTRKICWASEVVLLSDAVNYRSASQILGEPSIMPNFGLSYCSWLVDPTHEKEQWITLKFDCDFPAKSIHIYESLNPGAITNIAGYIGEKEEIFYFNNTPKPLQKQGKILKVKIPEELRHAEVFKIYVNLSQYKFSSYQIDAAGLSSDTNDYQIAIDRSAFETKHYPVLLSEEINSEYTEIGPVISPAGDKLFFTRANSPDNIGGTGQDIYMAIKNEKGEFAGVKNIGPPLNNKNSNYVISVLPGGNEMMVGNIYLPGGKSKNGFSISKKIGERWQFPDSMHFEKYRNYSKNGTFCLSPNRKVFISSIKYNNCRGGLDLYVSFLQGDSVWTEPVHMGDVLNTAGNEITPHIAPDGTTLYFSSDGFPGYGRQDVFVSKRLDDTWLNWSKPKNLGFRINSNAWDAFYTITASGKDAYYVSTVAGTNTDIFTLVMEDKNNNQAINPVTLVNGKVINTKDSSVVGAEVIYEELPTGNEAGRATANPETGEYKIVLPAGKKYGVRAEKKDMASETMFLDLTQSFIYAEQNIDLKLVPVEDKQTLRINNVFFDFGRSELLQESFPELNRIVELMKKTSNMKVQINGHTDDVGTEDENMALSQERAQAVSDYLISKGISETRIKAKGFGETKHIAENTTEEGRRLNRRVELVIIME